MYFYLFYAASDADGDEALSPESQGSVSKEHTHTKKQRTHKRGRGSGKYKYTRLFTLGSSGGLLFCFMKLHINI